MKINTSSWISGPGQFERPELRTFREEEMEVFRSQEARAM